MIRILLIAWAALFFCVPARAAEPDVTFPLDLESVSDMPGNWRATDSADRMTSDDGRARALSRERYRGTVSSEPDVTPAPNVLESSRTVRKSTSTSLVANGPEDEAGSNLAGAGRRDGPSISPALLCRVQSAIRHKSPAWPAEKCERVAAALNVTTAPRTLLAIAINESDLRERAIAWHGPRVADIGLLGIRCLVGYDGRCTNGPARGYTVAELQSVEQNIAVANVLLTNLAGDVQGWNRRSRGYAKRIRALVAALDGRRVEVRSARTREQVRRILAVTQPRT